MSEDRCKSNIQVLHKKHNEYFFCNKVIGTCHLIIAYKTYYYAFCLSCTFLWLIYIIFADLVYVFVFYLVLLCINLLLHTPLLRVFPSPSCL